MSEVTIGVIGAGALSQKMIRATFNDQLEAAGDDGLHLVLPVSKQHMTEQVDAVLAWAEKNEVPVTLVYDGSIDDIEYAKDDIDVQSASKIGDGLVGVLKEALAVADARLFVFWDEDDDDGYLTFEAAHEAGVPCFDLTNGLEDLSFADDEPTAEEETAAIESDPEAMEAAIKEAETELNTAAEMGRLTVGELKEMVAERKITLNREGKGRISKKAYVAAILIHDETGQTEFVQTDDGAEPIDDGYDAEAEEYAAKEKAQVSDEDDEPTEADLAEEAEVKDIEDLQEVDTTTGEIDPVEVPDEEDRPVTLEEKAAAGLITYSDASTSTNPSSGSMTIYNNTTAPVDPRPSLVGNCGGCGGPVFAKENGSEFPEVAWNHAEKCSLAKR